MLSDLHDSNTQFIIETLIWSKIWKIMSSFWLEKFWFMFVNFSIFLQQQDMRKEPHKWK